ncbi:uncharacterized protein [Euphorbia lathyris]|uniref:uncharacterized protein n=1 Tax=Euphorbia lathyris TaxID=212925 RepID=UPI0033131E7D
MGMNLFDNDDETENVNISNIEINTEFARRYEHNKKREYLQRYGECVRNGQIVPSDAEADSETSDEEDIGVDKFSKKKDIKYFENLIKIRKHDPSVYKSVKLFESESDSDIDMKDKNKDMRKKPKYLKDVVAQHLIEEGPEFEDVESSKMKKTYFEEQDELKKAFLDEVRNLEEDGDGGALLKEKENKEQNEGDADDGEFQKKVGEYFGPDDALDENSKFLKNFFEKQMWIDRENKSPLVEDDEVDDLLSDEEEVWDQEDYEASFNYRYEENVGDRVMGHSRFVEGSVRKEKNSRKEQRKNKLERMKISELERKEELKYLKNLKKKEMKEKLMKVMEVAGVNHENDFGLDLNDLEEDFDPAEYDKKMKAAFGDEYYTTNDADPEFGSDDDGEIKKPDFDKEDELLGLPKGWDAVERDDGFLAARKRALEKIDENDDHGEEDDDDDEEEKEGSDSTDTEDSSDDEDKEEEKEGSDSSDTEDTNDDEDKEEKEERGTAVEKTEEILKNRKRKEKISLVQRAKEAMLEEYYKLDYEDTVGDLKTRFKYAKVTPNRFGLKTEEVLILDDKDLNQYVPVKKIAAYRESEWKVPNNKKKEYKEKAKEIRRGKSKNHRKSGKKNSSRDNGDKTKSASDQERKSELEETNTEVANLSSRKKRKLRLKELKLSQNRMAAYQNVQMKANGKRKR